jgi:hypothetical protein
MRCLSIVPLAYRVSQAAPETLKPYILTPSPLVVTTMVRTSQSRVARFQLLCQIIDAVAATLDGSDLRAHVLER